MNLGALGREFLNSALRFNSTFKLGFIQRCYAQAQVVRQYNPPGTAAIRKCIETAGSMHFISTIEQAVIWFQEALGSGLEIFTGRRKALIPQRAPIHRSTQRSR